MLSLALRLTKSHPLHHLHHPSLLNLPQIRHFGRKSGASAFSTPRPPTRKQRQRHTKRMQQLHHEKIGKHSPPNSQASLRRNLKEEHIQHLKDMKDGKSDRYLPADFDPEYNQSDMIVDDLIGNTAHLTSTETPRPSRLGYKYKHQTKRIRALLENGKIPSDEDIALLLRSHRDAISTPTRPIGIPRALHTILREHSIPLSAFGRMSYHALLSCAASGDEAQTILRKMQMSGFPPDAYTYSILAEIHARRGDYRKCRSLLDEMSSRNIEPTVPAFTSLLKACRIVVDRGATPRSLKREAFDVGWEAWKELRIRGLNADAMAYGAILHLMASKGQPEKCLGMLEEMNQFEVKPTTFAFTASLRAIARSHEIALRFEGGKTKKHKRREMIAAHHGNMARQVVIAAEAAEVTQDRGFIAALIRCVATAGDSATAKAVFLASEVRRNMTHLRTIGSDDHLRRIRGMVDHELLGGMVEEELNLVDSGLSNGVGLGGPVLMERHLERERRIERYHEREAVREHGKDSRVASALLLSFANAMKVRGLGSIWSGKVNKGYLCEYTLREIPKRREPKYHDDSIPGLKGTEAGLGSAIWEEEEVDKRSKRLKKEKYRGLEEQDWDMQATLDDINIYRDDDMSWVNEVEGEDKQMLTEGDSAEDFKQESVVYDNVKDGTTSNSSMNNLPNQSSTIIHDDEQNEIFDTKHNTSSHDDEESNDITAEQQKDMQLETKQVLPSNEINRPLANQELDDVPPQSFEEFVQQLQTEIRQNDTRDDDGNLIKVNTIEAMNLYEQMLNDYRNGSSSSSEEDKREMMKLERQIHDEAGDGLDETQMNQLMEQFRDQHGLSQDEMEEMVKEFGELDGTTLFGKRETSQEMEKEATVEDQSLVEDWKEEEKFHPESENEETVLRDMENDGMRGMDGMHSDVGGMAQGVRNEADIMGHESQQTSLLNNDDDIHPAMRTDGNDQNSTKFLTQVLENQETSHTLNEILTIDSHPPKSPNPELPTTTTDDDDDDEKDDLELLLPDLPPSRLRKIRKAYKTNLGNPSLLQLIPLVRENMPEYVTRPWLVQHNLQNAYFVMKKSEQDQMMDIHVLNGMLQVEASTGGGIDRMLAFHDDVYGRYGLKPTQFSDRLVLQTLLQQRNFQRALTFKQKLNQQNKTLDLLSYGSLIEYCANRNQLGSALLLLKECIDVHGFPPGEQSLKQLRADCRRKGLEQEVGLKEMIGEDPWQWVKRGEKELKREKTYKGRRGVIEINNKFVKI